MEARPGPGQNLSLGVIRGRTVHGRTLGGEQTQNTRAGWCWTWQSCMAGIHGPWLQQRGGAEEPKWRSLLCVSLSLFLLSSTL